MKNVYKRINRGLVLAGVLLVAFVIYVITDTMQFRKTKPLLKGMAADYMQALCEINVTPEAYRSLEELEKQPDYVKSLQDNLTGLLNQHWQSVDSIRNHMTYYYGMNRSEVEDGYSSTLKDPAGAYGYITKMTSALNPAECSVTKCGVNTAQVIVSFDCVVQYVGNPCWFTPAYTYNLFEIGGGAGYGSHVMMDTENPKETDVQERSSDLMSTSITVTYEFTYQLVDGQWKIIYVDDYGWGESSTVIVSGEGGEA